MYIKKNNGPNDDPRGTTLVMVDALEIKPSQQTFVLMKTSWRRLDQDEYVHLSLTSSEDVFKTCYQVKVFLVTQFQDIFETSSKPFWDVLLRRLSTGGLPRSYFREIYGHCKNFLSFKFPLYYIF